MSECLRETTASFDPAIRHTYLLDGTKMVAYVPVGGKVKYFQKPIEFNRRGRTFVLGDRKLFTGKTVTAESIRVAGSKPGTFYYINKEKMHCSCPGFTYRGHCKHIDKLREKSWPGIGGQHLLGF